MKTEEVKTATAAATTKMETEFVTLAEGKLVICQELCKVIDEGGV